MFERFLKLEKIGEIITFPRLLFCMIIIGIVMRLVTIVTDVPKFDGAYYCTIGYNVATDHDFTTLGGVHSYSSSLTYPAYLAGFYVVFGFSITVTRIAALIVSIAVLVLAYITTANLMGKEKALIVTALLALMQPLIAATGKNYVDNMILLFLIPALWANLKSFENSRYIIVASFFAGLTYYTRSDVGFYFVIGGMVAYGIWRFYFIKWNLFKDKNHYIAFLILLIMTLFRAYLVYIVADRPLGGTGDGSSNIFPLERILNFFVQMLFHAILIGGFLIFWPNEFKQAIFDIKKEYGILMLSVFVLTLPIVLHASAYPLFSVEPIEKVSRAYITILYVPLMWSLLINTKLQEKALNTPTASRKYFAYLKNAFMDLLKDKRRLVLVLTALLLSGASVLIDDFLPILFLFGVFALLTPSLKKRITLLLIASLILSVNYLTYQYWPAYVDAVEDINNEIEGGDIIALVRIEGSARLSPNRIYPYLSEPDVSFAIYLEYSNLTVAKYIISELNETYEGYELLGIYHGSIRPSILKNIAIDIIGGSERYQLSPLYLWKRV